MLLSELHPAPVWKIYCQLHQESALKRIPTLLPPRTSTILNQRRAAHLRGIINATKDRTSTGRLLKDYNIGRVPSRIPVPRYQWDRSRAHAKPKYSQLRHRLPTLIEASGEQRGPTPRVDLTPTHISPPRHQRGRPRCHVTLNYASPQHHLHPSQNSNNTNTTKQASIALYDAEIAISLIKQVQKAVEAAERDETELGHEEIEARKAWVAECEDMRRDREFHYFCFESIEEFEIVTRRLKGIITP